MTTFSRLNGAEQQRWIERGTKAQQRYGISHSAWVTLCDVEHVLASWTERECNGIIQRDEPTNRWPLGRPRCFGVNEYGEPTGKGWYVPDRAAGAMRRAVAVLAGLPDVSIYWQQDPRGCTVYIYYRAEVLERGGDVSSLYSSVGTACFY